MKRLINYLTNQQWALFVAGLLAIAVAVQDQAELLPEGDIKTYIMAGVVLAVGFLTRARVFAQATVDAIKQVRGS